MRRNLYFDFLRGIAIIMVVGIHTTPSISGINSCFDFHTVFVRQLLNCAVPLFLAISGFFIAKKDLSTRQNRINFWRKQIPAVYIPCIVWSLGWFALHLYGGASPFKGLLLLVCCGFSVYYFIALIIQYYIITPFISVCYRGGVIFSALVSAISICIVTYMLQVEGYSFPLIIYAGPFPLWIIFFVMGVALSQTTRDYSITPAFILIIIGLIGSMVSTTYYLQLHGSGLGIKLSSFVYSAGVILLLISHKVERLFRRNRIADAILYIGEISFAIYFAHVYFCFLRSHIWSSGIWIIDWIGVLLLTIILITVLKAILPAKIARKYLGIR